MLFFNYTITVQHKSNRCSNEKEVIYYIVERPLIFNPAAGSAGNQRLLLIPLLANGHELSVVSNQKYAWRYIVPSKT